MVTMETISAALSLVDSKKENLRKAFEDLQSHSSSLSSFNLSWFDLDSHFSALQSSLQSQFTLLQSLTTKPQSQPPKQPPNQTQQPDSLVSVRPELKALCENMDGLGLRNYIAERRNERATIRAELPDALGSRRTRLRCEGESENLADEWKGKVGSDGENPLEAFGFLLLLGTYGLADGFSVEELVDFVAIAARYQQTIELCRVLGSAIGFLEKQKAERKQQSKLKNLSGSKRPWTTELAGPEVIPKSIAGSTVPAFQQSHLQPSA
ncbi:FRIGIDA-like protein 2 [Camellia lanceoleosa]|uniref:FRIGIDA-like protein 2 n=1 Tax=Camellia lanceoleosa TaxID=1840588 RepID=A0ACC0HDC6_9ERIC|nr:FRIGIDA-like protein 2 [Camellia lanceoleosa]